MRLITDTVFRNTRTGVSTSLNEILEKLDTGKADVCDACTLGDYLSLDLLGLELDDDGNIAILNWLAGWETELTYEGSESVLRAFKRLVSKIETKYPTHPSDKGEPRRLNVTYVKGKHSLETDKLSQFDQLEPFFYLACEVLVDLVTE
jgi:hypothetical protein